MRKGSALINIIMEVNGTATFIFFVTDMEWSFGVKTTRPQGSKIMKQEFKDLIQKWKLYTKDKELPGWQIAIEECIEDLETTLHIMEAEGRIGHE